MYANYLYSFLFLDINRSPYDTMFDWPAKIGIASLTIPYDELFKSGSEKDVDNSFEKLMKMKKTR